MARRLACTFPSTTPTSLASLGTGVAPAEHGIWVSTSSFPTPTGCSTTFVGVTIRHRPDGSPSQRGSSDCSGPAWVPAPCCLRRSLAAASPKPYTGARNSSPRKPTATTRNLSSTSCARRRTGLRLYRLLDTAAHAFGIGSAEWHAAGAYVDALLTRLVEALPPDAALLITADHGGLNVPEDGRIDLDADSQLSAGVRVVAGEPRVRYLHTEPGAATDVIAIWSELLNGRAEVRSRDNAVAAGLFGNVLPDHLPRIGDVVVTCLGDTAVLASAHEAPEWAQLVGFHGASTPLRWRSR